MSDRQDDLPALIARVEDAEGASREMALALANFTECQLATLEGLPVRSSKSERLRHQTIADDMVNTCRFFRVQDHPKWDQMFGPFHCPRLRARLAEKEGG